MGRAGGAMAGEAMEEGQAPVKKKKRSTKRRGRPLPAEEEEEEAGACIE